MAGERDCSPPQRNPPLQHQRVCNEDEVDLTTLSCSLSHLDVSGGVISFDVRVDGLFHQPLLELSLRQLTPHGGLIAALSELIGPVQVANVLNQNLE